MQQSGVFEVDFVCECLENLFSNLKMGLAVANTIHPDPSDVGAISNRGTMDHRAKFPILCRDSKRCGIEGLVCSVFRCFSKESPNSTPDIGVEKVPLYERCFNFRFVAGSLKVGKDNPEQTQHGCNNGEGNEKGNTATHFNHLKAQFK